MGTVCSTGCNNQEQRESNNSLIKEQKARIIQAYVRRFLQKSKVQKRCDIPKKSSSSTKQSNIQGTPPPEIERERVSKTVVMQPFLESFNAPYTRSSQHIQVNQGQMKQSIKPLKGDFTFPDSFETHIVETLVVSFEAEDPTTLPDPTILQKVNIKLVNGANYEGQWFDNMAHGHGKYIFKNGAYYKGDWLAGVASGEGEFVQMNGDRFQGEWVDNSVEGYGIYTYADGSFYEGEWKNDRPSGVGKERLRDGSEYDGCFFEGMRHGVGKLLFPDGSYYDGQFNCDHMHGIGNYYWPDGRFYDGEWRYSMKEGLGKLTLKDGSFYQGEYKNDKKEGFGIFKKSNGQIFSGWWKDGLQHGMGEFVNANGVIIKGKWINGRLVEKQDSVSSRKNVTKSQFG